MKVKWKQQELLFVTIITLLFLVSHLEVFFLEMDTNQQVHSYFINVVHIFYLYLCYVGIWKWLIPKTQTAFLKQSSEVVITTILWFALRVLVFAFFIGPINNFITYYVGVTDSNYSVSPFFHPQPLKNLTGGLNTSLFVVILYSLYSFIRDRIIHALEKEGNRKSYRIIITNQITTFIIIFLTIPCLLDIFDSSLASDPTFLIPYLGFVPAVFSMFMVNVYWIFPFKSNKSFTRIYILKRIIIASTLCSIPALIVQPSVYPRGMPYLLFWALLIFIITPVSWYIYQQRKDIIHQLRGTEEALIKTQSDIQFLKSQINPHFLFNALNTLYGTALMEKSEKTAQGIQQLGDMMRFMLQDNLLDRIPMSRELEYLKNYISLMKLRLPTSSNVVIEENIDAESCDHMIAPMLLIPFVENAFKHGVSLRKPTWIKIDLTCTSETIRFHVSNSIHISEHHDAEKQVSGVGIDNVKQRLEILYKDRHSFSRHQTNNKFVIELSIRPSNTES